MLTFYVVKGENFPDSLKSNLFVTCEYSISLNSDILFGQTQAVKKSTNPIWDNNLQNPFTPPIFSTKNTYFTFTIHDQSENSFVGKGTIDFSSTNEFEISKLIPISFMCQNAKNSCQSTLYIQIESNFSNLKEIELFKFEKHSYIYCYYSYETIKEYGIIPDLSFLIISKDDFNFAKNFKEFNSRDISLNMNPIGYKPTNTGRSQLSIFNIRKSAAISKYVFVPILVSNGYIGNININFAFITTKSKKELQKPHLGARYQICVYKERMISFPVAFTFENDSKLPIFYDIANVNISDCEDINDFIFRTKNSALLAALSGLGPKLFPIQKISSFFKINYPDSIHISLILDQKTDHSISAAAYTNDFALLGRVSAISNHSDLNNSLCYTYKSNENDQTEFKRNEIFINFKALNENFKNAHYILIVIISPTYESLKRKRATIYVTDADTKFPLLTFQPMKDERLPSWMPIVLHKNSDSKFDILTMNKFFNSPKPFEAQIMMKNFLRNKDDLESFFE